MERMKAYFIWSDNDYQWGDFAHGETASKAKAMFWKKWSYEVEEYIYLRAKRVPELDNKPFTADNIIAATDLEDWNLNPTCSCEICLDRVIPF